MFPNRKCDIVLTRSQQAAETEDTSEKLGNLRTKEMERKQQIAGLKANIEKLKEATENRPASVDTTELDKEIVSDFACTCPLGLTGVLLSQNAARHRRRGLQEEQKTLDRKFQAYNEKGTQINNNLDQIQNQ